MRNSDQTNDWFETAFGIHYPLLYAHRDDSSADKEVECLMNLLNLKKRPARVLDVCCGAGRHSEALVKMGLDVSCIDLSPNLLQEARLRPELDGRLVRGDIRDLPFESRFNLALNLFTSFGYFLDDDENEASLSEMARVLLPSGVLVLDHVNRYSVESSLCPKDTKTENGVTMIQERRIERNRVIKNITVLKDGREPLHIVENVRLYFPEEMEALFISKGFVDFKLVGSFDGSPYNHDSKRMIAIAEKG